MAAKTGFWRIDLAGDKRGYTQPKVGCEGENRSEASFNWLI
jgi:hypothetical protein